MARTDAKTLMAAESSTPPANADPVELAKFSALAHRWWDPTSEFKPLHDINPLRLNYIRERCAGLSAKAVLDVGCGGGILAEAMAAEGAKVTAIDLSQKAIGVARLHQLESGSTVDYRLIAPEALAEQMAESFDLVTCMELLEHVPNPASTVAACARLVKRGGLVMCSTINRNAKAYVYAVLGAEYLLRLLPRGTHDYARFLKPSELAAFARKAGLEPEELVGMRNNPLGRLYRLSPDTSVNYIATLRRGA